MAGLDGWEGADPFDAASWTPRGDPLKKAADDTVMDDVDDVDDREDPHWNAALKRKERKNRIRAAARQEAADLRDHKKATPKKKQRVRKSAAEKRVYRTPKKVKVQRPEAIDHDLTVRHCGCSATNHLDSIPPEVVASCREHYHGLTFRQRKHFQFYELLSFHVAAWATKKANLDRNWRTTASGTVEHLTPGTAARAKYEAAAVHPEFCIRDPDFLAKDNETKYPCCQKAVQIVFRGFGGSTLDEMNKLIQSGQRHHWTETLRVERQRVSPMAQAIVGFVCWVETQVGEPDPLGGKIVVGCETLQQMYLIYCGMIEREGWGQEFDTTKPASEKYFKAVYKQYGGQYIKNTKHQNKLGKCTYCAELKLAEREFPFGSAARKEIALHHTRHIKWQALQRIRYWHHRMKAKTMPWR
jgi:hypothetical protein